MKKNVKNNESENVVVANNEVAEMAPVVEGEVVSKETLDADKQAIAELIAKAAEARAAYEAARKAAKEAKERAKKANARPVRDHYFEARVNMLDPSTAFKKMETFYYVEKAIVDYLNEGKTLGELRQASLLRVTKDSEHPRAELTIATYKVDAETLQIVIEA